MSNMITQRLLEVYNYSRSAFGLYSAVAFEKRANIAPSSINKWSKEGKDASIDSVVRILESFPNISAEWVMRGEGTMLNSPDMNTKTPTEENKELIAHLKYENEYLRTQLNIALESLKHAHEHYNK